MLRRPFIASISGKGGTGKTTFIALLLKVLIESRHDDTILVVDADPATNLPDVLGIHIDKTIGDIVEEFKHRLIDFNSLEKSSLLRYWILRDCLIELNHFDFIAMGRGEGEGCYCYINSVLARILLDIVKNYTIVLMDMEAGLEHLSRRVDRNINTLIVVIDSSIMSVKTAERIISISREVNIKPEKFYLIGNRVTDALHETLVKIAKKLGYEYAGSIPEDENILKYSIEGRSLLELPSNSPSIIAIKNIARNIGLIA